MKFCRKKQKYTRRYARLVTQEVVNSDLRSVAKRHKLTEDQVESMINQISREILPIDLEELKRLGI
ncbi:helix-turn-helix domain-containing protein [Rippkaea orientalis]|uniref:helix-turn-helix domain-containing protein n=1 Tax=Rippkaea orientalis TaxID=2546366 RepID=UPI0012FF2D54